MRKNEMKEMHEVPEELFNALSWSFVENYEHANGTCTLYRVHALKESSTAGWIVRHTLKGEGIKVHRYSKTLSTAFEDFIKQKQNEEK